MHYTFYKRGKKNNSIFVCNKEYIFTTISTISQSKYRIYYPICQLQQWSFSFSLFLFNLSPRQ